MIDLLAQADRWTDLLGGDHSAPGALAAAVRVEAPQPGCGHTDERWELLAGATAVDAAVGRLAEGHLDAVAILREAGREPKSARYGVWASRAMGQRVLAEPTDTGWRLSGSLPFSSGAGTVDTALIVADPVGAENRSEARLLFELATDAPGVRALPGTWPAIAMSATDSLMVELHDVEVGRRDLIGPPGFYTGREGFWYGSLGVAACWAGAAAAIAARAIDWSAGSDDAHTAAHMGALYASISMMSAVLTQAATDLDAGRLADRSDAQAAALTVRHLVEREVETIVHHAGRAGGATLLAQSPEHAGRIHDLLLYVRQSHAERDLAALGSLIGARRDRLPGH